MRKEDTMWWLIGIVVFAVIVGAAWLVRRSLRKTDDEEFEDDDPHLQEDYRPAAR